MLLLEATIQDFRESMSTLANALSQLERSDGALGYKDELTRPKAIIVVK